MTTSFRPFPYLIAILFVTASCNNAALGAAVARCRVYNSDKTIVTILKLLGVGGLFTPQRDVLIAKLKKVEAESPPFNLDDLEFDSDSVRLLVDGKPGELEAQLRLAAPRIARYVDPKGNVVRPDDQTSVELRYEFRYRHLRICRSTFVAEGHLRFETRIYGKIKQADYLSLTVDGQEFGAGTRVVLSCRAHAPIGRHRCGPITRLAEHVMAQRVDEKLWDLERHAKTVVNAGGSEERDVSDLVNRVIKDIVDGVN